MTFFFEAAANLSRAVVPPPSPLLLVSDKVYYLARVGARVGVEPNPNPCPNPNPDPKPYQVYLKASP